MGEIISVRNSSTLSGSTTVSLSIATGLSYWGMQKTLLINLNDSKALEQYLSTFDLKFNLDYIDNFRDIESNTYSVATSTIGDKLEVLGSFSDYNCLNQKSKEISDMLISLKENYDFIILDCSNYYNQDILDICDKDLIMVKPSYKDVNNIKNLTDKSTIIFNGIYETMKMIICEKFEEKFANNRIFCTVNDADIYYQTNLGLHLYEYLVKNIKSNDTYINDILEICFFIQNLDEETSRVNKRKGGLNYKLFK